MTNTLEHLIFRAGSRCVFCLKMVNRKIMQDLIRLIFFCSSALWTSILVTFLSSSRCWVGWNSGSEQTATCSFTTSMTPDSSYMDYMKKKEEESSNNEHYSLSDDDLLLKYHHNTWSNKCMLQIKVMLHRRWEVRNIIICFLLDLLGISNLFCSEIFLDHYRKKMWSL